MSTVAAGLRTDYGTPPADIEANVPIVIARSRDAVTLAVGVVVLGMAPEEARSVAAALARAADAVDGGHA